MKQRRTFLQLGLLAGLCLALAGCGPGAPNASEREAAMKASAGVAEVNLKKIRDGIVAFHAKNQKVPDSIDDLVPFKAGPEALEPSDDYADLGYSFYNLEFDAAGKLKQGWLVATPRGDRTAMVVRMNAVSGEFDYTQPGEPLGAAPGPANGAIGQGSNGK